MTSRVRSLLRTLFRRDAFESGVDVEVQFHIDEYTDELIRAGVPADEAARRARVEFGNVHNVRLECREARGLGAVDDAMRTIAGAWRSLRRAPGYSIAVVGTLALGLGVNTLVFAAVHGLLIEPLPFTDSDRIVWAFVTTRDESTPGKVSGDEANALAGMPSIAHAAVIGDRGFVRAVGAAHSRWQGLWVTAELFDVLDIRPAAGRALTAEHFGAVPPAMMISFDRWQQDFGGDPSIVGREIHFEDNHRYRVVGVLPAGLEFPLGRTPQSGNGTGFAIGRQDFWILGHDRDERPGGAFVARVAGGATVAQVRAQAATLVSTLPGAADAAASRGFQIVSLRDQALGPLAPALPFLQAFAALVFVIACVNVAGLVLVRAARRGPEAAVRVALGARTGDLVRMLFAEGVWLAAGGAVVGWLLVWVGRSWILALAAESSPILQRMALGSEPIAFLVASAIVVTILIATLPLAMVRRVSIGSAIKATCLRQTPAHRRGPLAALVVGQIALSTLLLLGAGALGTSLYRLLTADAGYQPSGVVAADVTFFFRDSRPVVREMVRRFQALPGVDAVGLIHSTPLTGKWVIRDSMALSGDGSSSTPPLLGNFVAFDYFKAMGIPILAGRDFSEQDYLAPRPAAIIVNDVAARAYFPDGRALGARVQMNGRTREIVGIVKGTRDVRIDTPAEAQWYDPVFFDGAQVMVRTTMSPGRMIETLRAELTALDSRVIITRIEPLERIVADSIVEQRMTTRLVGAFAALALTLALVGLYGVLQVAVSASQREIGIRAALGEPRNRLVGGVIRSGLRMAAIGIGLALVLAMPVAGLLRPLLFETPPFDPRMAVAVGLLVMSVSALTCLRPAWRAATIDPVRVLRSE